MRSMECLEDGLNPMSCMKLLKLSIHRWHTVIPLARDRRLVANLKHGHARRTGMSVEYRTWLNLKNRCLNSKHRDYPKYGGRHPQDNVFPDCKSPAMDRI